MSNIKCSFLNKEDKEKLNSEVIELINNNNIDDNTLTGIITKIISSLNIDEKTLFNKQNYNGIIKDGIENYLKEKKELSKDSKGISKDSKTEFIIEEYDGLWERSDVEKDIESLYIFTDNTDRDSGSGEIDDESTYARKYGKGKHFPTKTQAVIRGLENAFPISTQRWFHKNENGKWIKGKIGRWTDKDVEEFKKVIKDEIKDIKEAWTTGNYKRIVIGSVDGFFGDEDSITAINKDRVPKLYEALKEAIAEIGIKVEEENGKVVANKKKKKNTRLQKDIKEATESLKATRPIAGSETIDLSNVNRNALVNMYNFNERRAITKFFATYFSSLLDMVVAQAKEYYSNIPDESLSEVELKTKRSLQKGLESEQRVAALNNLSMSDDNGNVYSLAEFIYHNLYNFMSDLEKVQFLSDMFNNQNPSEEDKARLYNDFEGMTVEDLTSENIDKAVNDLKNYYFEGYSNKTVEGTNLLGNNFRLQAIQEGWNTSEVVEKMINKRVRDYMRVFAPIARMGNPETGQNVIFNSFIKESMEFLKFENIRLDDSLVTTVTNKEEKDIDDEGSADTRSGLGLIKYKTVDPSKRMTDRMKTILSRIPKLQYSTKYGTGYIFDDLGMRVMMNPDAAHNIILAEMANMKSSKDLMKVLNAAIVKYPWLQGIKEIIIRDSDFRNEFYSKYRNVCPTVCMITEDGLIKKLNSSTTIEAFLQDVTKNYENQIILGPNSLYKESGEIDTKNTAKMRGVLLFNPNDKKKGKEKNYHLLAWVKSVLKEAMSRKGTSDEKLMDALSILRGEYVDENGIPHDNVSLEILLRNLGINTNEMNLNSLIPIVEDTTKVSKFFTQDMMFKIDRILQGAINISKVYPEDHLVSKYQSSYVMIGHYLTMVSDGYTQANYSFNGKMRNSYMAPDFISKLTSYISDISNDEAVLEGNNFIEENYGKADFFKNQRTGEYNNVWLEILIGASTSEGNLDIREHFKHFPTLAVGGSEDKYHIGKVDKKTLANGLIKAFFSINDDKRGNHYGVYHNPLYSDTDALDLFQFIRYDTINNLSDYRTLMENLGTVIRQEFDRIIFLKSGEKEGLKANIEIDNFNDKINNGKKFTLFPNLNPRLDGIISDIKKINEDYKNNPIELDVAINDYFTDIAKIEINKLADDFTTKYSDKEKVTLYEEIRSVKEKVRRENETPEEKEARIRKENEELVEELTKEESEEKKEDVEEIEKEKVAKADALLRDFYMNDFFAQTQLIQLLCGDMAYAKNFTDFVKRNKEAYACGERLYTLSDDINGEDMQETCIYLEDSYSISNTWESLRNLLESDNTMSEMDKDILKGDIAKTLGAYQKICTTDGQSFRTLDSFKKILKALGGRWTEEMENAYNNIKARTFTAQDFLALWNPIKPFMFSNEFKTITIGNSVRTEKVMTQHKNSEYMITAMYSMLNTALNNSPELVALNEFMEDPKHPIDVAHFHSAVKLGCHSAFDITYNKSKFEKDVRNNKGVIEINDTTNINLVKKDKDGNVLGYYDYKVFIEKLNKALEDKDINQDEYNNTIANYRHTKVTARVALENQLKKKGTDEVDENKLHVFPMEDYMIVQPSADHLEDAVAIFGSQLRNIIPADLSKDFTLDITIGGKKVTLSRDEAVLYYNTLIVDTLRDSFSALDKKFSNIEEVKKALDAAMRGNDKYGEDIKAALELTDDKTAFKIPFNSPSLSNKIDELILSVFKNNIQRQKINGGNTVLVSNFGLSDNLKIKYRNDDVNQGIEYIPAYLPASKRDFYKDFLEPRGEGDNTYWVINFEKLKSHVDPKVLEVIGYRIPTEDKYSIMPIRIVGFMPVVAGTTIMLPSDIITMSGTDFDIDKLFLMIRTMRRETFGGNLIKRFKDYYNRIYGEDINKIISTTIGEVEEDEVSDFDQYILRQHQHGYTDEEVYRWKEKSQAFKDFMKLEGMASKLDTPRYSVDAPSLKKDQELDISSLLNLSKLDYIKNPKLRKDVRNNMLIDFIWGVMTSTEGSKLAMQPGNFDNVKLASRQQKILHERKALKAFKDYVDNTINKGKKPEDRVSIYTALQDMKLKDLEQFYSDYGLILMPADFAGYIDMHKNLMDGRDLIGIFAVNSSSHYKLQFANLTIAKDNMFKITLPGMEEPFTIQNIDTQKSPLTNKRIGTICAEFQAASPDNGKDPCLGDLGCSPETAARVGFLARIGLDPQVIGILNTCDDIIEYGSKLSEMTEGNVLKYDNAQESLANFEGNIEEITELIAKYRTLEEGESMTEDENRKVVQFYHWMSNIDTLANVLNKASCFTRVDSPNGALAISCSDIVQQIFKVKDFYLEASAESCEIKGLDKIIDFQLDATKIKNKEEENEFREILLKQPIPRLQAFYTFGITSAVSLSKRYLPQLSDTVLDGIEYLRMNTKREGNYTYKKDSKFIKKFFNELTKYLLSSDSIFSGNDVASLMEKRNYYIKDFPMKLKQFLETKDDKGNYVYNEIREMNLIKRLFNRNRGGITFENIGGLSDISRKFFREDLDAIMTHENPNIRDLGMDLLMYTYFDNGISFGHSNFGIFFSTFVFENLPRFVESLREKNGKMETNYAFVRTFVEQFLLNNSELILPVRQTDYKWSTGEKGVINLTDKGIEKCRNTRGGFVKYVRFGRGDNTSKVFEYVRDPEGKKVSYKEINFNNKKNMNKITYYDASIDEASNIAFNELANRGATVNLSAIKSEVVAKDKGNPELDLSQSNSPTEDGAIDPMSAPAEEREISNNEVPEDVNPVIAQDKETIAANKAEEMQEDFNKKIIASANTFTQLERENQEKLSQAIPLEEIDSSNVLCEKNNISNK